MTSVSVIVPAYNAARTLRETLASIGRQSSAVAETIIVDDGSADETAEVAAAFAGGRLVHQTNAGTASALNAGLAIAGGDVLGFLDADDLWAADTVHIHLDNLDRWPDCDASVGWVEEFVCPSVEGEARRRFQPRPPQLAWLSGATFVRAASFRRVGSFAPQTRGWPWIEWVRRAKLAGLKFRPVDQVVLRRRLHPGSLSMSTDEGGGKGLLRAARLALKPDAAIHLSDPN